jgi:hypothetical protein
MKNLIKARRPSFAAIIACLALFVALGGGSYAAKKLKLKNNSVTTPKIKDGAVTNPKLADDAVTTGKIVGLAVTTGKLGNAAVTTDKIADSAVTAGKLEPSQRSETFEAETTTTVTLAQPFSQPKTTAQTLALPAGGKYLVTAQAELFNTNATGNPRRTNCSLSGVTGSSQASDYYDGLDVFTGSGGIALSGISTGGTVTLGCNSDGTNTAAGFRRIEAVRVG